MKAKRRAVTASPRVAEQKYPSAPKRPPARVVIGAAPPPASSPAAAPSPVPPGAVDLTVDLGRGLVLPNPILVASGTFGYGIEYGDVVDVDRLGAICCKGTTLKAADRQPHAPGDRDAGRDAQLDRPPEPGRGRGHRQVRRDVGDWKTPVIVNVAGESVAGLRRGRPAARRRPGRGRHRAQHLLPERRRRRAPVRDRRERGRRGHRRRPAGDHPAAPGQAVAERRRHPADRTRHRRRRRRRADRDQHAVGDRRSPRAVAGRCSATSTAGCPARRSSPSRCGSSTRPHRRCRSRSSPSAA